MPHRTWHSLRPRSTTAALALVGCLALLRCLFAPSTGAAQPLPPPVDVDVEALFGEGTLLESGWVPVLVTLRNHTNRALRGELILRPRERGWAAGLRHVSTVDVPAGATRSVLVTTFTPPPGHEIEAAFAVDDGPTFLGAETVTYAPGRRSVVVLADPPRLRSALLDLVVTEQVDFSLRQVQAPVGTVSFDRESGDPRIPSEPAGWSTVAVLVASPEALERANPAQRAALEDWIAAGGALVLFPRDAADLRRPWLVAWAGQARVTAPGDDGPRAEPHPLRYDALAMPMVCADDQRAESFGCSRALGFGRVFVASYDGMSPAAIESMVPRELVRAIYLDSGERDWALPHGRGQDEVNDERYGPRSSYARLRTALDPNQGFRPALGLVALVLLLYVVLVGPINFRWIRGRNPTLALVTTPLAALLCMSALLAVGYVGKGVRMRYRRVELVEGVEGRARMQARRYTGLFSTRPGSFDLPASAQGPMRRLAASAQRGPTHRATPQGTTLADFRAGLWETTFLREDRFVEVGQIHFEREQGRLTAVRNDGPVGLTHGFLIDARGDVFVVGDVGPGDSAPIPAAATDALSVHFGGAYVGEQLAERLGLPDEDDAYASGLRALLQERFLPTAELVFYARLEAGGETIGGRFLAETDLRVIRVAPARPGAPVQPASGPGEVRDELDSALPDSRGAPPITPPGAPLEVSDVDAASTARDGGAP